VSAPRKPELTESQRRHVELARKVAAASAEDLAAGSGIAPDDRAVLYSHAFGYTRATVSDLLAIIDDLTGGAR
jgi:hypothetical protein